MPEIEVLLPKMGESVAEATIVKWVTEEGGAIEADEPIVEIATDKVDSEVPAPEDGILIKRLCEEGDVVQVGQPIALISVGGDAAAPKSSAPANKPEQAQAEKKVLADTNGAAVVAAEASVSVDRQGPSGRFYSPLVRNIAKAEGIEMSELESIPGTGKDGRLTKKDLLAYLPDRDSNGSAQKATPAPQPAKEAEQKAPKATQVKIEAPAISVSGGDEVIEMDRMRKLISDHMVMSKHTSPHVTSYVEADMTNVVAWRNKWKNKFEEREGEKLTFTPIFIEAIVRAIKELPMVNVSTDGSRIIKRKAINIGMATALPSGNLIVPVIHNADQLNMVGLAKKVNDLAKRARENKLKPEEIQGGTYTVTNVGTFGNVMGTPIINQPQAAIMAVGAIRKKPAVIETPQGDFIGIRQMMFLSHSYDHRIVDGALGGTFVRKVADFLEQFDVNREI
jgi:2-oxoglutarate dehydrogenase E2 component (dihydrolipoamide succinyltransferase)